MSFNVLRTVDYNLPLRRSHIIICFKVKLINFSIVNEFCRSNYSRDRYNIFLKFRSETPCTLKSNKFRTLIFLKAREDKFASLWWQKVLPTHQKMREYCVFLTLSKNVLPFSAIYHEEHVILFPWGGYECYISTFNKICI